MSGSAAVDSRTDRSGASGIACTWEIAGRRPAVAGTRQARSMETSPSAALARRASRSKRVGQRLALAAMLRPRKLAKVYAVEHDLLESLHRRRLHRRGRSA